jgi:hypothetical protein
MVHTFNLVTTKKGVSLTFVDDTKNRRIIFRTGSPAYVDFMTFVHQSLNIKELCSDPANRETDMAFMKVIRRLRIDGYRFMANINNVSIFTPIFDA